MPQPFKIGTPIAQKNSSISRDSAAPPLMKNLKRPPVSRARRGASTSRSARRCCAVSSGPGVWAWKRRLPTPIDHSNMARRSGLDSRTRAITAAYIFS